MVGRRGSGPCRERGCAQGSRWTGRLRKRLIVLLWADTIRAFFFTGPGIGLHFGVGLGSLIFFANILLLTAYTFSCHSWRHLVGGGMDCYSCSALSRSRYGLWRKVTFLNERHGLWAMMSLVSVALVDVYVYLVASGTFHDPRLF